MPLYLKFNPLSGEDIGKRFFGAAGLDMLLRVNGTEDEDMAFCMSAGIFNDARRFHVDLATRLTTQLYFLDINPSVTISSRRPAVKYNLGIGTLIRLDQGVEFSSGSLSPGFGYTNVDTVDRILNTNSRSVIPFVSLGLSITIKRHFQLQLTVQPTLLNFYDQGTSFSFTSTSTSHEFNLAYQPVYFGAKVFYFFRPRR